MIGHGLDPRDFVIEREQIDAKRDGSVYPSFPTSASTSDQHFEPSFSFQIA